MDSKKARRLQRGTSSSGRATTRCFCSDGHGDCRSNTSKLRSGNVHSADDSRDDAVDTAPGDRPPTASAGTRVRIPNGRYGQCLCQLHGPIYEAMTRPRPGVDYAMASAWPVQREFLEWEIARLRCFRPTAERFPVRSRWSGRHIRAWNSAITARQLDATATGRGESLRHPRGLSCSRASPFIVHESPAPEGSCRFVRFYKKRGTDRAVDQGRHSRRRTGRDCRVTGSGGNEVLTCPVASRCSRHYNLVFEQSARSARAPQDVSYGHGRLDQRAAAPRQDGAGRLGETHAVTTGCCWRRADADTCACSGRDACGDVLGADVDPSELTVQDECQRRTVAKESCTGMERCQRRQLRQWNRADSALDVRPWCGPRLWGSGRWSVGDQKNRLQPAHGCSIGLSRRSANLEIPLIHAAPSSPEPGDARGFVSRILKHSPTVWPVTCGDKLSG